MNGARHLVAMAALATPLAGNTPGPIRLLSCTVSGAGLLEAVVENTSDTVHTCNLRCDYVASGARLSHRFAEVTIPSRYSGVVAQADTGRGQPGTYSGNVDVCEELPST